MEGRRVGARGFFWKSGLKAQQGYFWTFLFLFRAAEKEAEKGGCEKNQHEKGVCLRGDFRGRCKLSLELEQDFPFKKKKTHLQKPTMGCKVTLLWLLLQL